MNERTREGNARVSRVELRQKLENHRQPGLKSRLDERRQEEALWLMITRLRTSTAA